MNIDRDDYFNTISSLALGTIVTSNPIRSRDLLSCAVVAGVNHIVPVEFRNNLMVKPFLTRTLLENEHIANIFTLLDTLNILFHNPKVEQLGAIVRQGTMLSKTIMRCHNKPVELIIILGLKILYWYERSTRSSRTHFQLLHMVEHIDLWLYHYNQLTTNQHQSLANLYAYMVISGFVVPSIYFKITNLYLETQFQSRLPIWFDRQHLLTYFQRKLQRNVRSNDLSNYVIKIVSPKLNWSFMSWSRIEKLVIRFIRKLTKPPDLIVGILSGGAFIVPCIQHHLGPIDYMYVRTSQWSGVNLARRTFDTIQYYLDHQRYLDTAQERPIEIVYTSTNRQWSTILIFDDTVSSGKTIHCVKQYITKRYPRAKVTDNPKLVDIYSQIGTVPIMWEWGVELD